MKKEARGANRERAAHSDVERKVKEKGERSVQGVVWNDSLMVKRGIPEIRGRPKCRDISISCRLSCSRWLTEVRMRRFNVITDKQVAMDEPVAFEITTNETRTTAAAAATKISRKRRRLYKSSYIGLPSRSINHHLPSNCSVTLVKMPT